MKIITQYLKVTYTLSIIYERDKENLSMKKFFDYN